MDYCTLLNGAEVTLAGSVAAGSTAAVATSATFGLLSGATPKKDQNVPLLVHAYGATGSGFSDVVSGTLGVATSASPTPRSPAVVTTRRARSRPRPPPHPPARRSRRRTCRPSARGPG
ncbi:hypothetical protein ACQP04_32980 [Pseudonocardia halophobica]|uniref:hypothetical protein n=1 Tax=Pseudonocardia halophobica TaxID=29401 RepID=UPI003D916B3E